MDVETAIRTRRTHKTYRSAPVDHATLLDLFELARWAPNHHLTNPWRFRVLGERSRGRLAEAAERAKPGSAGKLGRAPTLIVASAAVSGDDRQRREDLLATAVASYIVLLGAHARGLAGYWRTVQVLAEPSGREALGIPAEEEIVGLLHLGQPRQEQPPPERAAVEVFVSFLD
jgi:nitroreductase